MPEVKNETSEADDIQTNDVQLTKFFDDDL